jgi:predicted metal-binding membrane protein
MTTALRFRGVPAVVPAAIGAAWLVAMAAQVTGGADLVQHHGLAEGGHTQAAALGLFVLSWQLMIVAMMLPSAVPMVRLFTATASGHRPGPALASFLAAYATVWVGFGVLAFFGDLTLHQLVDAVPELETRPWLITGGTLLLAGAFQFTDLKDRCLDQCRHPAAFLLRHYRRGNRAAFDLGWRHGVFCLGCCWALMLLMFAVGVANLAWMAVLTAVMAYEKAGTHGRRLTPLVGVVLLGLGLVILVRP